MAKQSKEDPDKLKIIWSAIRKIEEKMHYGLDNGVFPLQVKISLNLSTNNYDLSHDGFMFNQNNGSSYQLRGARESLDWIYPSTDLKFAQAADKVMLRVIGSPVAAMKELTYLRGPIIIPPPKKYYGIEEPLKQFDYSLISVITNGGEIVTKAREGLFDRMFYVDSTSLEQFLMKFDIKYERDISE